MSPSMTVRQECPCGAKFDANGDASFVASEARRWHAGHDGHTPVAPGPCWDDPGIEWPDGDHPRCELRAGHEGAHECDRGSLGGTSTWPQGYGTYKDLGPITSQEKTK